MSFSSEWRVEPEQTARKDNGIYWVPLFLIADQLDDFLQQANAPLIL